MSANKSEEVELTVTAPNSRKGELKEKSLSEGNPDIFRREDLGANAVSEEVEAEAEQVVDGERVSFADLKKKWKTIDKAISADNFFANMPFILFLAGLAVIYIYNTHKMETTTREIDKLKNEMKEYRWQYMSAKSNLMYNSKQTEVAIAVDTMGLKELREPPKKIVVTKSEY